MMQFPPDASVALHRFVWLNGPLTVIFMLFKVALPPLNNLTGCAKLACPTCWKNVRPCGRRFPTGPVPGGLTGFEAARRTAAQQTVATTIPSFFMDLVNMFDFSERLLGFRVVTGPDFVYLRRCRLD